MRFATLILLGLVFAAGLGFAAHLIARDTVALPVSSIAAGDRLAPVTQTQATPAARRRTARQERRARTTTTTAPTTTVGTTTEAGDDHGRNRGRGRGGDDSSSGRGRGGGDDD